MSGTVQPRRCVEHRKIGAPGFGRTPRWRWRHAEGRRPGGEADRGRHQVADLLMLLLVCAAACTAPRTASRTPEVAVSSERLARTVAAQTIRPRVRDLTIDSPALGRTAKVRLLLPREFMAKPTRRWPVLWLLHGCCDTYESWTRSTDVEHLSALAGVLVVMPEAGAVGHYSDWYHPSTGRPSRWETFHLSELRQLLERDWRASDRRAIAGVSMGGLGAMTYAARHPGMFQAAASYSGVLDTRYQGLPMTGPELIQTTLLSNNEDQDALWGDPQRQADVWAAHNPYDLAPELRHTSLFVSFGDGQAGPLDASSISGKAQQIEKILYPQNTAFVRRLHHLGIPVTVDAYSPGTHDWLYWRRELHQSLPILLAVLQH
jgi:diacylglycerol O-acyltransferase / trehalose O-mycolyltransferase